MDRYEHSDTAYGYEKTVEGQPAFYEWTQWTFYPDYDITPDRGGRYICASGREKWGGKKPRIYKPLSRSGTSLFLEFAGWPEEFGMDRTPLESDKNADAAYAWACTFGVLGVDPSDVMAWDNTSEVIGEFLDRPGPGGLRGMGSLNLGYGGPGETVERFALEAWKAHLTLRLYEAATKRDGPDADTIVGLMPDRRDEWDAEMGWPTVREFHGKTPKMARDWALSFVEEIVAGEIRGRCWPIPVRRDDGSHVQGWAFDSLLGAMWLQMLWIMLGEPRRCSWCERILDMDPEQVEQLEARTRDVAVRRRRKPPSHKHFCDDTGGRCRANWNYHHGTGKSSKHARKRERDRRRGKS
jgi:hypothetical protein